MVMGGWRQFGLFVFCENRECCRASHFRSLSSGGCFSDHRDSLDQSVVSSLGVLGDSDCAAGGNSGAVQLNSIWRFHGYWPGGALGQPDSSFQSRVFAADITGLALFANQKYFHLFATIVIVLSGNGSVLSAEQTRRVIGWVVDSNRISFLCVPLY